MSDSTDCRVAGEPCSLCTSDDLRRPPEKTLESLLCGGEGGVGGIGEGIDRFGAVTVAIEARRVLFVLTYDHMILTILRSIPSIVSDVS